MQLRSRLTGKLRDAVASGLGGSDRSTVGNANEANRIEWVSEALRRLPAGSRILDAGAGEQRFKPFCAHLNYVSQDFGKYDGKGDGTGLHMGSWEQSDLDITCDITAIPEPDASFDAILCTEVLEHLPSPLLALQEFSRLLREGGEAIITAPFCSITHFAPYHFYTGFNRYFYETHFPAYGLEVIELTENGNYFEYLAQELRRVRSVAAEYGQDRTSKKEALAIRIILNMLERLSHDDKGSGELLNFGYHVRARKR
jgi:SAM-dependent methyltransferase